MGDDSAIVYHDKPFTGWLYEFTHLYRIVSATYTWLRASGWNDRYFNCLNSSNNYLYFKNGV